MVLISFVGRKLSEIREQGDFHCRYRLFEEAWDHRILTPGLGSFKIQVYEYFCAYFPDDETKNRHYIRFRRAFAQKYLPLPETLDKLVPKDNSAFEKITPSQLPRRERPKRLNTGLERQKRIDALVKQCRELGDRMNEKDTEQREKDQDQDEVAVPPPRYLPPAPKTTRETVSRFKAKDFCSECGDDDEVSVRVLRAENTTPHCNVYIKGCKHRPEQSAHLVMKDPYYEFFHGQVAAQKEDGLHFRLHNGKGDAVWH